MNILLITLLTLVTALTGIILVGIIRVSKRNKLRVAGFLFLALFGVVGLISLVTLGMPSITYEDCFPVNPMSMFAGLVRTLEAIGNIGARALAWSTYTIFSVTFIVCTVKGIQGIKKCTK